MNKEKNTPLPNVTMDYLQKQVKNLRAQLQRLEEINERYKQQFIIWQYNAYMHEMTEDKLNKLLTVYWQLIANIDNLLWILKVYFRTHNFFNGNKFYLA